MTRKRKWIFFLLLLSSNLFAYTQSFPVKKLKFETLTLSDGLSQGMINCILQDRHGFMWFATKDGLNRYDGYKFIVYRHSPSDDRTVADNFIEKIFEDSRGRLWVGTSSKGLDLFNRENETFIHIQQNNKSNSALLVDQITGILEDKAGNIWMNTTNGLFLIKESEGNKGGSEFSLQLIDKNKCSVVLLPEGEIFVSNINSTYSVKVEDNKIIKGNYKRENGKFDNSINLIVKDTFQHTAYIFHSNSVSAYTNGRTEFGLYKNIHHHSGLFLGPGWIDSNGLIWFCNLDWLIQFDVQTGNLTRIIADDENLNRMLSSVNYVYRDKSGIIWIGTKGFGILKYNPRSEKFHHTDNESIYGMSAMNDGNILLCKVYERNVYIFNKSKGTYEKILPDLSAGKGFEFKPTALETVIQDDSGFLWLGQQKLIKYDIVKNKVEIFSPNKFCFPVYKDKNNNIWCGTENALSAFDKKSGTFIDFKFPFTVSNVPYKFLQAIIQDETGIFWLGTTRGLLRFNNEDKSWKEFRNIPDDSTSLSFDLIFSLCPDPVMPDKFLWVGTSGGLNKFELQTGKCIRYTEKDGLPNNVIYGILSDNEKNLWISTNKGICRFNTLKNEIRNYDIRDGLQSNEFSRYAFSKSTDGFLFFGGVNGFNFFDPHALKDNPFIPQVHITDIKLKNQSISFKTKNSPISKPIYLTDHITLEFEDNMFSFDFSASDFTAPQKNQYQYKLVGFDDDWINGGQVHSATYTNLDPGDYTFQVIASNNDGIWNKRGTTLKITVLSPWYMTWWFRLIIITFISAIIYFIYRYRLRQELKLLNIRNRIASDLHDEIGSTLSSVSLFSEIVRKRMSNRFPEINPMMSRIVENINGMMEAMNDIVWTINSRNDRFENIINRMRANAAELFEAKGYQLHIDFEENLNEIKLGMQERKNIYLIFKEAINNAAKYSEGQNIWISLVLVKRKIHMKIRDDGKGFDATRSYDGNGILSMRKRADELKGELKINSEFGAGTTIEVDFPFPHH